MWFTSPPVLTVWVVSTSRMSPSASSSKSSSGSSSARSERARVRPGRPGERRSGTGRRRGSPPARPRARSRDRPRPRPACYGPSRARRSAAAACHARSRAATAESTAGYDRILGRPRQLCQIWAITLQECELCHDVEVDSRQLATPLPGRVRQRREVGDRAVEALQDDLQAESRKHAPEPPVGGDGSGLSCRRRVRSPPATKPRPGPDPARRAARGRHRREAGQAPRS